MQARNISVRLSFYLSCSILSQPSWTEISSNNFRQTLKTCRNKGVAQLEDTDREVSQISTDIATFLSKKFEVLAIYP